METQDIVSIGRCAAQAAEALDPTAQEIAALKAKVAELERANAELAADRDNWRQQALATETKTRKRKGK